ncbi:hypothetical protein B0H13DRAFT_2192953, partial [Mycena leptocephala]
MVCHDRMLIFYAGLLALAVVPGIHAQASQMFEWGFTQTVSTSLPSCRSFPLEADPRTANGTPPYYMMAFPVGGTPITSFIGTNASNLTWMVTHPVGTKLVLGVVDSRGNSGGIDSPLYEVIDGATTQCTPPPTSEPEFKITANVTDMLNTCQPWGLTLEGGTPPYSMTIATMNSPNITNMTLGPIDTVFTWINRAAPQSQLIATASDSTGRWATGSPFISTQGSADTSCLGLVTTSTNGTAPNGVPQTAPSHSMSRSRIATIAGASAGALLVFAIVVALVLRHRRLQRSQPSTTEVDPFFSPRQTS